MHSEWEKNINQQFWTGKKDGDSRVNCWFHLMTILSMISIHDWVFHVLLEVCLGWVCRMILRWLMRQTMKLMTEMIAVLRGESFEFSCGFWRHLQSFALWILTSFGLNLSARREKLLGCATTCNLWSPSDNFEWI